MERFFGEDYYEVCSSNSKIRKQRFFCNLPLSPINNETENTVAQNQVCLTNPKGKEENSLSGNRDDETEKENTIRQDKCGTENIDAQSSCDYEDSIVSGTTDGSVNDPDYFPSPESSSCQDAERLESNNFGQDLEVSLDAENNSMAEGLITFPNLNYSEMKENQNQDILGVMKANGEKRKGNKKKDFCLFCESYVLNFARHIMGAHSLENGVKKIMSLPPKNKNRKSLLDEQRRKGNFLNSSTICKPVRNSTVNNKLLPCTNCRGFFSSKQLWRHRKNCLRDNDKHHQARGQDMLLKNMHVDKHLREKVFPRMRPDEISFTAKSDPLICAYGNRYLKSHRDQHFINVTSRKMRELARLLLEIRKIKPQTKDLFHALKPENFEVLVSATKIVASYDNEKDLYNSASTALNLGTAIKQCAQLAIVFVLKRKEVHSTVSAAESEADLKTLIQLIESEWRFEITTQASNDLNLQKWNKITMVPLASDLKIIKNYLLSTASAAIEQLDRNPDKNAYVMLMEAIFCGVLLLNRRRPGELQRLPLHIYASSEEKSQNYEEFTDLISTSEKLLISKFKRVVIRGKRGRGVPVLFSPDAQEQIKVLLKHRDKFCSKNNFYLFGNPGTVQTICGYKVISKHAKLSGVKNPKAITATKLRKHLATLTQVLNMSENDIEQLSSFMGHNINIHRGSYRLPNDIYQTAKISKLLLLMEKGQAGQYKGKNLDEINITLEPELEDQDSGDELFPITTETCESSASNCTNFLSDDRGDVSEVNNSKQIKGKRILVAWTGSQKEEARKFFAGHIKKKQPPKKHECEELKKQHSDLFMNKDWLKIKVFVQNEYVKKK